MDVVVVDDGTGPVRLVLQGRLDAAGAEQVEATLLGAVTQARGDTLLDLSGVGFVGSLGIRLLISASRQAKRHGRRCVICAAQPSVAEVFAAVSLDELVVIEPDEAAARARLGA
jgi:anti-anti-sigma factor